MTNGSIMNYLLNYGSFFIFIIIFWEHLNLPGLPSSIIMPLIGAWISKSNTSFISALIISVISGLLASCLLYSIGFYGGTYIIDKYTTRFPKQKKSIDNKIKFLNKRGNIGVFISRLIPMARTITPIPAGALKLNFFKYTLYSALGIFIWNLTLMSLGYIFGENITMYFN